MFDEAIIDRIPYVSPRFIVTQVNVNGDFDIQVENSCGWSGRWHQIKWWARVFSSLSWYVSMKPSDTRITIQFSRKTFETIPI